MAWLLLAHLIKLNWANKLFLSCDWPYLQDSENFSGKLNCHKLSQSRSAPLYDKHDVAPGHLCSSVTKAILQNLNIDKIAVMILQSMQHILHSWKSKSKNNAHHTFFCFDSFSFIIEMEARWKRSKTNFFCLSLKLHLHNKDFDLLQNRYFGNFLLGKDRSWKRGWTSKSYLCVWE